MSFSLTRFTKVYIKSINVRAEMNGKDPVPAIDIGVVIQKCSNRILDLFDAGLRQTFYRPANPEDDVQPGLDGVEPDTDTPVLRSSSILMPILLNKDYIGRNVVIDYGLGGKHNIEFSTCDVDHFKAFMYDNGCCDLEFRIQVSSVNEKALGKLGGLVKHSVEITLMSSPEADGTQEQIPGTETQAGLSFNTPVDKPAEQKGPTEAFVESESAKAANAAIKKAAAESAKKPAAPASKTVAKKKPTSLKAKMQKAAKK